MRVQLARKRGSEWTDGQADIHDNTGKAQDSATDMKAAREEELIFETRRVAVQDSSTATGVVRRTFCEWLRINGHNFWRDEILIVVPNEIAVLLSLCWNMEILQENKWTTFNNIVTSSLILMARGNLRIDRLLCLPTNCRLVIVYCFPSIYFFSNPAVCKSVEGSVTYDGVVDVCTSHSNVMISNWILQQTEETDMGRS
jgi:hypothetical protein